MIYFQIFLDIILIIGGFFVIFGKGYFSEKGRNLATKEDIKFITKEIETVKNEIYLSNKRKDDFFKEKKEVGLTFFDHSSYYIEYTSKVIDVIGNNSNNKEIIFKQIEDMRLQGAKIISSFLKIYIYYDDNSFTKSAEDYYNTIVKIQRLTFSLLIQIERIAQEENLILGFDIEDQMSYRDRLLDLTNNGRGLIEKYIPERVELLENEVYKAREKFIIELSKILKIND